MEIYVALIHYIFSLFTGFTGSLCERPVCNTNPCRYGGTCLGSNAGPGFLCLCPVGRGGALCQDGKLDFELCNFSFPILILFSSIPEVNIIQPSFTSSVGGYSSYLSYPVMASDVAKEMEAQFHFSSAVTDQVST